MNPFTNLPNLWFWDFKPTGSMARSHLFLQLLAASQESSRPLVSLLGFFWLPGSRIQFHKLCNTLFSLFKASFLICFNSVLAQNNTFLHSSQKLLLIYSRISAKLLYISASNSDSFFSEICRPQPLLQHFLVLLTYHFRSLHSPQDLSPPLMALVFPDFTSTPCCGSSSHI